MTKPVPDSESLPHFQQLQQAFAGHIRNPNQAYQPEGEAPIEPRRLKVYEELFYNNVEGFFSQLFPVCVQVLGETRWHQLMREYMQKHHARTPLFHELGQEFLAFLSEEYEPLQTDPEFLLELAHYEWVELALAVSSDEGFAAPSQENALNEQQLLAANYDLSPVAWPLAYQWPVHELSADFQPQESTGLTTLLAYRDSDDHVQFMNISPLLYQWVLVMEDDERPAWTILEELTEDSGLEEAELQQFAKETLSQLMALGILRFQSAS